MSKELVISATPHETRVAILEDGHLCEIYVEREKEFALVGSIYKGRVTRVLPGMQSAFVDIGLDSDAFLYVSDFFENLEDYDGIVTSVEGKLQRMEQQSGPVFATPAETSAPAVVEPPEVTAESPAEPAPSSLVSSEAPPLPEAPPRAPQQSAPPTSRPYEQRGGRGGYGRGGGGRRGRWDNRRGGRDRGRDRGPRRDFPPSKYASPSRSYGAPSEPEPPLPADYEPIILPGESLAKYRDRAPSAPVSPPPTQESTAPLDASQTALEEKPFEAPAGTEVPAGGYGWTDAAETPEPREEAPATPPAAELRSEEPAFPQSVFATPAEAAASLAPPAAPEPVEAPAEFETPAEELTPEEATQLAEQFAEAAHEELAEEEPGLEAELEEETRVETDEPYHVDTDVRSAIAESLAENALPEEVQETETDEETEELPAEAQPGETEAEEESEIIGEEQPAEMGAVPEEGMQPGGEPQPISARVQDSSRARFQRPMRRGGRRRGGPPRGRPQHRHVAPRRPQLISELLKAGQEIIVQIAKEPMGKKGARITSHVALPGRFLVYMPTVDHIGVSRKIGSAEERSRLRRLLGEMKGQFPGGFIVRTAAAGATDDEIRSDVEFLGRTWNEIKQRSEQRKAPAILHRDLNLVERILRDHVSNDYTAIWIDNEEEFAKVVDFVGRFQPRLVNRVKLYTKDAPIFEEFGIQQEIDKSLRPKVWLKSGGYIVINHTEALVAIDVNTGKFVGRGSTRLEDTIVKTNLEAVKEIVRQIRLRDLGGIIVIDFIDMEERRNREKVMIALDDALRGDKAPSKALGFNEFGLVAITRKRTKQALERVLCQPCPYCTGSGMVKSIPTICYEIQAEARKMAPEIDSQSVTLRVHPEIGKALKTRESALVEELEHWTKKSVIIQSDPTLHWEQYDIY
ncbi:MAG TPA: Rne/Rng family ribonuclease [Candidatus Acidoferrales bacterium]|nr:Rne/Rng family ribonuclease [Candidatus Acidoferrales bacterium]